MVGSAAMRTEVVGMARTSGSAIDEVRLRLRFRLRGVGTSSCNGLVDLEERVCMHQKKTNHRRKLEIFLFIYFLSFVFFLC